jgi:hypothetical protein
MFLHYARANRLAAAYLLFTVVLLMVPKVDIPETPFDEGNTPTTEILVVRADSSLEIGSGSQWLRREYLLSRTKSISANFYYSIQTP